MLSGPNCNDGVFTPSDNWTGNNDSDNKLAAKGVCVSVCLCNTLVLFLHHLPARSVRGRTLLGQCRCVFALTMTCVAQA